MDYETIRVSQSQDILFSIYLWIWCSKHVFYEYFLDGFLVTMEIYIIIFLFIYQLLQSFLCYVFIENPYRSLAETATNFEWCSVIIYKHHSCIDLDKRSRPQSHLTITFSANIEKRMGGLGLERTGCNHGKTKFRSIENLFYSCIAWWSCSVRWDEMRWIMDGSARTVPTSFAAAAVTTRYRRSWLRAQVDGMKSHVPSAGVRPNFSGRHRLFTPV